MAELENISKYITQDLKESLQATLAQVVKDHKDTKIDDLLDRSTQPLGVTKILKQGFTP